MNCDRIRELLSSYIDGRLTGEDLRAMEDHLSHCEGCAAELGVIKEAKDILRKKVRVSVPADMDMSILRILNGMKNAPPRIFAMPASAARYALVAVAVMLFFVTTYYLSAPFSIVSNPKGTVKIYLAKKNEWIMLDRSMRIGKNDIVKTFQNSQADITMPRVCSMRLKSNTEVRLAALGSRLSRSDIRYSVDKGKALIYHRQKTLTANPFIIETPEAVNTALGTDFMVSVVPEASKTWVGVLDGAVLVKSLSVPIDSVVVNAGQKTEVYADKAPLSPSALADAEWNEVQELYQIGVKPQVALLISFGEGRTRELLRPCPLYVSDSKDSPIPAMLRETVRVFNEAIRLKSREKHLEAIKKFEEIVADFPDKKYNVQFLLFIGAYYYYLEQYDDAVDVFEKVIMVYPDSRLASIAQYAIGIIYQENLGDSARAEDAYRKVLAKYPDSPEAAEAERGLDGLSAILPSSR